MKFHKEVRNKEEKTFNILKNTHTMNKMLRKLNVKDVSGEMSEGNEEYLIGKVIVVIK